MKYVPPKLRTPAYDDEDTPMARPWPAPLGQALADVLLSMQYKRKSRVWFGDDVDYLNALIEAEKAVQRVMSFLVREDIA